MTATVVHNHVPIFRVVRRGWPDPADAKFSQLSRVDNRWNTPGFPALYCCCSETVARAIMREISTGLPASIWPICKRPHSRNSGDSLVRRAD